MRVRLGAGAGEGCECVCVCMPVELKMQDAPVDPGVLVEHDPQQARGCGGSQAAEEEGREGVGAARVERPGLEGQGRVGWDSD